MDHTNSPYKDKVKVLADANSTAPLVVLFGFATSQAHNLEKFTRTIYDNIEYKGQKMQSILLTPTVFQLYSHSNNLTLGAYLWHIINENSVQKRPLFFHLYSGSSFLIHAMLLLLEKDLKLKAKIQQNLAGIIWDSSPIYPDEDVAAKATAPLMDSFHIPRFMWYPLLSYVVIPLYWTYDFGSMNNARTYRMAYWETMKKFPQDYSLPQLFIYSTKDTITSSEHLDELVDTLQALPNMKDLTRHRKYEDTLHVQHFKTHTKEYTRDVTQFVNQCLVRWESEKGDIPFPEYTGELRSKL
jgi:hypothetical protein